MVKQGKIIVLDGLDGCGKSTQFAALGKLLTEQGETVKPISFPMYDKPSAATGENVSPRRFFRHAGRRERLCRFQLLRRRPATPTISWTGKRTTRLGN